MSSHATFPDRASPAMPTVCMSACVRAPRSGFIVLAPSHLRCVCPAGYPGRQRCDRDRRGGQGPAMMFKTPVEETHFSISLCFRSEASGFVAIFMAMCSSSVLFPSAILQQYTSPEVCCCQPSPPWPKRDPVSWASDCQSRGVRCVFFVAGRASHQTKSSSPHFFPHCAINFRILLTPR